MNADTSLCFPPIAFAFNALDIYVVVARIAALRKEQVLAYCLRYQIGQDAYDSYSLLSYVHMHPFVASSRL